MVLGDCSGLDLLLLESFHVLGLDLFFLVYLRLYLICPVLFSIALFRGLLCLLCVLVQRQLQLLDFLV